jgi:hypothetical protein
VKQTQALGVFPTANSGEKHELRRDAMKQLVTIIVALGLAIGFTAPAFSAGGMQPLTKSDCKKAGLKWDSQANVCEKKGK